MQYKKIFILFKTIKYMHIECPTAMIMDKKTYIIQEIINEEHMVFSGGGVGTKYALSISKNFRQRF